MSDPAMNPFNVAVLATLVAFSSASQDIVIDAYRRESLTDEEQTIGASAYVLGYRIGALAAGAGGLILADYMTYQMVYAFMSAIMIYGVFITLIAEEPKNYYEPSNFMLAQEAASGLHENLIESNVRSCASFSPLKGL
mgnify:CR=1 FL=1